jgi:predicted AlkP superfamily pyrophosphatase or phosphodiesterase
LADQEHVNDPAALVVVVSDHGFAVVTHMVHFGAAFVDAGLIKTAAKGSGVIEWQAQPWALGCMFAIMLNKPDDVAVKQQVHDLLEKLAAQPSNGIEEILDSNQIASVGGPPEATFVVTLRNGYAPGPNLTGALVTDVPGHRGTHGYNPQTTQEMRASFFAAGKSIAHGKNLGIIDMRGVAPTVANLLGISPPTSGRSLICTDPAGTACLQALFGHDDVHREVVGLRKDRIEPRQFEANTYREGPPMCGP